jgi:hypothetical protein
LLDFQKKCSGQYNVQNKNNKMYGCFFK